MHQPDRSDAYTVSTERVVTDLRVDEIPLAAELLGRAYRDNPLTIALVGDDPEVRRLTNEVIFGRRIAVMQTPALAVRDARRVTGVCGFDPPGGSEMSGADRRIVMEALLSAGPEVLARAMTMLADWETRKPKEPHWHLGPVGVDPDCQGAGIGSAMVEAFCAKMDEERAISFLETDQERNALLYARFGFVTVDRAPVLGVPMWFQVRRPQA